MATQHLGHCPKCGPDRWADVLWEMQDTEYSGPVYDRVQYRVLKCPSCKTVYYQESRLFSEDEDYEQDETGEWVLASVWRISQFPAPLSRLMPEWVSILEVDHEELALALRDFYGCVNADLRAPAATAARKVVEISAQKLGADGKVLPDRLNSLSDKKLIGLTELDGLKALKDAGDGSAHRGWEPTPSDLQLIANVLEPFVERAFVSREAVKALAASVPTRK